jgi:hypothetical protein
MIIPANINHLNSEPMKADGTPRPTNIGTAVTTSDVAGEPRKLRVLWQVRRRSHRGWISRRAGIDEIRKAIRRRRCRSGRSALAQARSRSASDNRAPHRGRSARTSEHQRAKQASADYY